jgi:hypothetical protein
MPYPYRDPDSDLRGHKTAPHAQGRPPTEAESLARRRRHGARGEPGVMQPIWEEVRNGLPVSKPYARAPQDAAEAERGKWAWRQVAEIQARLRGEPPPPPMTEPWNLPPCPGCGYRMRCGCPGGA